MKIKSIFIISLLMNLNVFAKYNWSLQITDPSFEVKNINLTDKVTKPYLKKTGWRCDVSETNKNDHSHFRKLNCDFSIYKAGRVSSVLSCSKNRPYGELILDLYDERKDITFKLMLKCDSKQT